MVGSGRFISGVAAFSLTVAACAVAVAQTQPQAEQFTVGFMDPARPGRIHLNLVQGGVTVRGSNRTDVAIVARPRDGRERVRGVPGNTAGLRRLTQPVGFSIEEDRNELTIDVEAVNRTTDFELQVPVRTNLTIVVVNNGEILVENVDGELELENTNGGITLTNAAGTVIANTTNGNVTARMTSVAAKRPMAFTSLNGNVDVTLPASTGANVRLRSDMGEVLSDFDIQLRPAPPATVTDNRRGGGRFQIEVNKSILGTLNGGGPEIEMRTFNGNVFLRKGS